MANNNSFFFRRDLFERDAARTLPHDLQWAAVLDNTVSQMFSDANLVSSLNDTNNGSAGALPVTGIPGAPPPGTVVGLSAPNIVSSTQIVKQDSQGGSTVNVTFLITDQKNVDYELQVTKA